MIKAWLDSRSTKITISVAPNRRKIEFQGPNLEKSVESIKEMIDKIVAEERTDQVTIYAVHTA